MYEPQGRSVMHEMFANALVLISLFSDRFASNKYRSNDRKPKRSNHELLHLYTYPVCKYDNTVIRSAAHI